MTENRLLEARVNGRFAPGHSGNPGGRSRAMTELVDACRELTPKVLKTLDGVLNCGRGADKVAAARLLWEYGYGKPLQAVAVDFQANGLDTDNTRQSRIEELLREREAYMLPGNDDGQ